MYGVITPPLDTDELAAASLPPKHLFFPVVKVEEAPLHCNVGKHKIRWDRRKRDFQDGVEVTPDEDSPTMTELLDSEKHREIFNRESKSISFHNIRPSDVRNNPRVMFSKPKKTQTP